MFFRTAAKIQEMPRTPKAGDSEILREMVLFPHPVATASDLADELGYSTDGMRGRLKHLEQEGYVSSRDVGARATVWWVTDRGRQEI